MVKRLWIIALCCAAALACERAPSPETNPPSSNKPDAAPDKPAPDKPPAPAPSPLEARREKVLSQLVTELLERQHLRTQPLDDALSARVLKRYIDRQDPARLFLLEADLQTLHAWDSLVDDELHDGDLDLARAGGELLKKRSQDVRDLIKKQLALPFDWTLDESLETDGEKRPWCKDKDALAQRWRMVLKLQTLERIERIKETDKLRAESGAPNPEASEDLEARARKKLSEDYDARFARLDTEGHIEHLDAFFSALVAEFDPHSQWLPPAEKENFDIHMSGKLEGIGAVLGVEEHYVKVVRIVPGSASWRQGDLEAEDIILMVAQDGEEPVDVVDMRLNDVVRLIRGKKDTVVRLTVKKPDGRLLTIPITRDEVRIEESYAKGALLTAPGASEPIGYIDLPSFYGGGFGGGTRSSARDVQAILAQLQQRGVRAVILDLRSNGGGLLQDAVSMAGLFIDRGPIVQTQFTGATPQVLEDDAPGVVFDGDVIVLVNRFSASASEIVAGALQDYGRAVIVGTSPTHGKGTVQTVRDLDQSLPDDASDLAPMGVFKLTIQQFFRVNGASTQQKGVAPDVLLADPLAHIDAGEASLDNAIPWSQVTPANFTPWPGRRFDVAKLQASSRTRQAQLPAFTRALERTKILNQRKDLTIEPLQKDAWEKKRAAELKEIEALTPDEDKEPALFTMRPLQDDAPAPDPGDRKVGDDPLKNWRKSLERDPWVFETIHILRDMNQAP